MADKKWDRQADGKNLQTDCQIGRVADEQTDRLTDGKTDRWTD
jgi:hypothetical protein